MNTITSASNISITGSVDDDLIRSTGDSVIISALSGDDSVIARGQGSYIYGAGGNDTLILLPPLSATETSSSGSSGSRGSSNSGSKSTTSVTVSADTEVHGGTGNDDITITHDSSIVYGDAGDDYITVKLYASPVEFMTSLHHITLTGGDGRDTFSFSTSLPADMEALTASTDTSSTVSNYMIEAVITDFSPTATFCFDTPSEYLMYSTLEVEQGYPTDIILRDDAERFRVTLQGVTNIEDVVQATAVRFDGDSISSSQPLGNFLGNYGEDIVAIPEGISYYNHTVYVYDQYKLNVWLLGTDEINKRSTYRNISAKTLDARNSTLKRTLVGNWFGNFIYAGSNGDSLWGGNSANDTLYGGAGQDMFWYGTGDGTDFIRNFVCGSEANSDIINFYNGGADHTYRDNNALHVVMTTGEELIVPLDYDVDTEIQYSTDGTSINRAKVGELSIDNTFTYDAGINFFLGCSSNNTLKVDDSRANMIWLDGSYGQSFTDITNIDASESTGNNQIAGASNKAMNILGGEGASSLWGGIGQANDTLTGGAGAEMFFYGINEGDDVIIGAKGDDTINLYNISLSDVSGFETLSGGMKISFANGSSNLTLQNYSDSPIFSFADGSNWAYEKKVWVKK